MIELPPPPPMFPEPSDDYTVTVTRLPPLPEPAWRESRPTNPPKVAAEWFSADMMRSYAQAAVLADRETRPEGWRWNIQRDGEALLICFNNHERHEACEPTRYVPASDVDAEMERCVELVESLYDFDGYIETTGDLREALAAAIRSQEG